MAKAELKTKRNEADPKAFIESVDHEQRKADSLVMLEVMEEVLGEKPEMWGPSIIGYGSYHYRSASGREGDWFLSGFSPRKQSLTLYIMSGFDKYPELMSKLGKFKTGKGCLYVNKLADIDMDVLRQLIKESADYLRSIEPKD